MNAATTENSAFLREVDEQWVNWDHAIECFGDLLAEIGSGFYGDTAREGTVRAGLREADRQQAALSHLAALRKQDTRTAAERRVAHLVPLLSKDDPDYGDIPF